MGSPFSPLRSPTRWRNITREYPFGAHYQRVAERLFALIMFDINEFMFDLNLRISPRLPATKLGPAEGDKNNLPDILLRWQARDSSEAKPGDFLLTNSMSFGCPYIMATTGCIHDGWLSLTPRVPQIDNDYLFRVLESNDTYRKFERLASGATVKNLNIDLVRGVEIPLPPLHEQRRIAQVLDQADALRGRRREMIRLSANLKRSLFQSMFGDPVTNPKNWPTAKMKALATRITVGIVVKPSSHYRAKGVVAIRGTNIKPDGIDLSDVVFFSEADNATVLAKTRVWEGDLVVVRSGRPGLAAIVPKELDGVNAIDVLIVTPDKNTVRAEFLRDFFNSEGGKRIVLAERRGQIQQHFNVGSLSEAAIYLPPLSAQDDYIS